jgi:hypothetical protein
MEGQAGARHMTSATRMICCGKSDTRDLSNRRTTCSGVKSNGFQRARWLSQMRCLRQKAPWCGG